MSALIAIIALVAAVIIIGIVASLAPVARRIERENGIAAGLWFGGRHARQPRAYKAHRATRADRARVRQAAASLRARHAAR